MFNVHICVRANHSILLVSGSVCMYEVTAVKSYWIMTHLCSVLDLIVAIVALKAGLNYFPVISSSLFMLTKENKYLAKFKFTSLQVSLMLWHNTVISKNYSKSANISF